MPLPLLRLVLIAAFCTAGFASRARTADEKPAATTNDLFRRDNLIAWCIVPFDSKKRDPETRAAMLKKLGFKYFAYDFRDEHVPTFDAEIEACKKTWRRARCLVVSEHARRAGQADP